MRVRIGAFLVGLLVVLAGGFVIAAMAFFYSLGAGGIPSEVMFLLSMLLGAVVVSLKGLHLMYESISFDKEGGTE
jgi:Na+/H+-dicarboxylate symporter